MADKPNSGPQYKYPDDGYNYLRYLEWAWNNPGGVQLSRQYSPYQPGSIGSGYGTNPVVGAGGTGLWGGYGSAPFAPPPAATPPATSPAPPTTGVGGTGLLGGYPPQPTGYRGMNWGQMYSQGGMPHWNMPAAAPAVGPGGFPTGPFDYLWRDNKYNLYTGQPTSIWSGRGYNYGLSPENMNRLRESGGQDPGALNRFGQPIGTEAPFNQAGMSHRRSVGGAQRGKRAEKYQPGKNYGRPMPNWPGAPKSQGQGASPANTSGMGSLEY